MINILFIMPDKAQDETQTNLELLTAKISEKTSLSSEEAKIIAAKIETIADKIINIAKKHPKTFSSIVADIVKSNIKAINDEGKPKTKLSPSTRARSLRMAMTEGVIEVGTALKELRVPFKMYKIAKEFPNELMQEVLKNEELAPIIGEHVAQITTKLQGTSPIFSPGGLMDAEGSKAFVQLMQNEKFVAQFTDLALGALNGESRQNSAFQFLSLMGQHEGYLQSKKEAIEGLIDYAYDTLGVIEKKKLEILKTEWQNLKSPVEKTTFLEKPIFDNLSAEEKELLASDSDKNQLHILEKILDAKITKLDIDNEKVKKFLEIIPAIITNPQQLHDAGELFISGKSFQAAEKIIALINEDDAAKRALKENSGGLALLLTSELEKSTIKKLEICYSLQEELNGLPDNENRKKLLDKKLSFLSEERRKQYLTNDDKTINTLLKQDISEIKNQAKEANVFLSALPFIASKPEQIQKLLSYCADGVDAGQAKELFSLIAATPELKDFFQDNKELLCNKLIKAAKLKKADISQEIGLLVEYFLQAENAERFIPIFDKLIEQKSSDSTEMAKSVLEILAKDKKFMEYARQNKDNFAKLLESAVRNAYPELESKFTGLQIKHLIQYALDNPEKMIELGKKHKKGEITFTDPFAILTDPNISSFIVTTIFNKAGMERIFSAGELKIIEQLPKTAYTLDEQGKRRNFKDIQRQVLESKTGITLEDKKIIESKIKNDSLLIGAKFGTSARTYEIANFEANEERFTNASFEKIAFRNAKFEQCSFQGAKFSGCAFNDCIMDPVSFHGLIPELKKGNITMKNTKITGELGKVSSKPYVNLEGVDMKNIDLSEVTSMQNVNLKDCDLTQATLPKNLSILAESFNLEFAKLPNELQSLSQALIAENRANMTEKITTSLVKTASSNFTKLSDSKQITLQRTIESLYNRDDEIGLEFRRRMGNNPKDIATGKVCSIDKEPPKDPKDIQQTRYLLQDILDNYGNPAYLEQKIASSIMAQNIAKALLPKTLDIESQLFLQKSFQEGLSDFQKERPDLDIGAFLKDEKYKQMHSLLVEDLQKQLVAESYLSQEMKFPEDKRSEISTLITKNLRKVHDPYRLNIQEIKQIKTIAEKIANNLFGEDYSLNPGRKDDAKIIEKQLKEYFAGIKSTNNNPDISTAIEAVKAKIIGEANPASGLTKLYRDNSKNTMFGVLTGGIQLSEKAIKSPDFQEKIQNVADKIINKSIKDQAKSSPEATPITPGNVKEQVKTKALDIGERISSQSKKKPKLPAASSSTPSALQKKSQSRI